MHGHQPMGAEIFEHPDGLVRSHVDVAKGFRMISADGQQGDFGLAAGGNILEPFEVSAVSRVVDSAAEVLEDKSAVAAMVIAQHPSAPVFAGRECYLPVTVREA